MEGRAGMEGLEAMAVAVAVVVAVAVAVAVAVVVAVVVVVAGWVGPYPATVTWSLTLEGSPTSGVTGETTRTS